MGASVGRGQREVLAGALPLAVRGQPVAAYRCTTAVAAAISAYGGPGKRAGLGA